MTEWKEKRDASEFDHNVDGGDYGEWVRVEEAEAKLAAAEGKYGTVYGLRPMDHKARKHDPISPADPLERA